MPPKRNSTRPGRVALAQKEAQALELRKSGLTFTRIADALGYADPSGAHLAVKRALASTLQEPSDELRKLEVERLDALFNIMYRQAVVDGQRTAAERCLQIMDRRARLLGLDAPQRFQHEVNADVIAEVERLAGELGVDTNATPGLANQPSAGD